MPVLAKVVEHGTCSQALVEAVHGVAAAPMALRYVNEHLRDLCLDLLEAQALAPHLRHDEAIEQITHARGATDAVALEVTPPRPWPPCRARLKPIPELQALLLPAWEVLVSRRVLKQSNRSKGTGPAARPAPPVPGRLKSLNVGGLSGSSAGATGKLRSHADLLCHRIFFATGTPGCPKSQKKCKIPFKIKGEVAKKMRLVICANCVERGSQKKCT